MQRLATPFLPPWVSRALSKVAITRAPLRADRVAQRGRAAVDVDLVVGDAEVAHRDHRDAGEGLVDLVEIDLGRVPAGLLQHLGHRADRGGGELGRLVGVGGVGDDAGDGLEAEAVGDASGG